jgi:hypothetical protein
MLMLRKQKTRDEMLEDKKDRLRGQVQIGQDARMALDNSFLMGWFDSSERQLISTWESTPIKGATEIGVRENCHATLQLLRGLRRNLELASEGGDKAARHLGELVKVENPGRIIFRR